MAATQAVGVVAVPFPLGRQGRRSSRACGVVVVVVEGDHLHLSRYHPAPPPSTTAVSVLHAATHRHQVRIARSLSSCPVSSLVPVGSRAGGRESRRARERECERARERESESERAREVSAGRHEQRARAARRGARTARSPTPARDRSSAPRAPRCTAR